jgi:hypothetical protein
LGIWITGLSASGKSTVTAALKEELRARAVDVAVLESDALRNTFTPHPTYDETERDTFHQQLADVGALLTEQGVPVILHAQTWNTQPTSDSRHPVQVAGFSVLFWYHPASSGLFGFTDTFETVAGRAAGIAEPGSRRIVRDRRETVTRRHARSEAGETGGRTESLCPRLMVMLALAPAARLTRVKIMSQEVVYVLISVSS